MCIQRGTFTSRQGKDNSCTRLCRKPRLPSVHIAAVLQAYVYPKHRVEAGQTYTDTNAITVMLISIIEVCGCGYEYDRSTGLAFSLSPS